MGSNWRNAACDGDIMVKEYHERIIGSWRKGGGEWQIFCHCPATMHFRLKVTVAMIEEKARQPSSRERARIEECGRWPDRRIWNVESHKSLAVRQTAGRRIRHQLSFSRVRSLKLQLTYRYYFPFEMVITGVHHSISND